MNHRIKLEELKNRLEQSILSNSKEFRLSKQEIRAYHIALVNVLLQNAELTNTNALLKNKMTADDEPAVLDGGII